MPEMNGDAQVKKDVTIGQGENANGELDSKKSPAELEGEAKQATMKLGGMTKITREAGRDRSEDANPDVVQQGGGGAVDGKSGKPV